MDNMVPLYVNCVFNTVHNITLLGSFGDASRLLVIPDVDLPKLNLVAERYIQMCAMQAQMSEIIVNSQTTDELVVMAKQKQLLMLDMRSSISPKPLKSITLDIVMAENLIQELRRMISVRFSHLFFVQNSIELPRVDMKNSLGIIRYIFSETNRLLLSNTVITINP